MTEYSSKPRNNQGRSRPSGRRFGSDSQGGSRSGGRFGSDNRRGNRSGGRFNNNRLSNGPRFGNRSNFRRNSEPRQMHKAICSKCGKECEVPFKPTEGRDVLCNDCFRRDR